MKFSGNRLPAMAGRVAAALLAAGLWLATAAPVSAADGRRLELDYDIYLGGFHALTIRAVFAPVAAAYDIKLTVATHGIVDTIFSWTMEAFSRGRIEGRKLVPDGAGTESLWRGRRRTTTLSYAADGTITAELVPDIDPDDRDPVPQSLRRDTVDLGTAVLAMGRSMAEGEGCGRTVAVFDGRRRYDLALQRVDSGRLKRSEYSAYQGEAAVCRVEVRRIKGFRKPGRSRTRWLGSKREARVWMAQLFAELPAVPVRVESEVLFGLVRGHLAGAVYHEGGRTRQMVKIGPPPAR